MGNHPSHTDAFEYFPPHNAPFLKHTQYACSPLHRNRLGAIVKLLGARLPPAADTRILDIGCGLGNVSIPLASLGYTVTGIDIHAPSIARASANNRMANLNFETAPLNTVNISKYSGFILSEVLEHVAAYRDMLAYLAGNMREKAVLILTVPNGWSPLEMVCRPSYKMKTTGRGMRLVKRIKQLLNTQDLTTADAQTPHVNFFRLSALLKTFQTHGLKPVMFYSFFFIWPLWETLFSHRVSENMARRDFVFSLRLPPALRTLWCFLLIKL